MAKVTFSARKDPLLRPRRAAKEPSPARHPAPAEEQVDAVTGFPAGPPASKASRAARGRNDRAVEEPAGVIAVPPRHDAPARSRRSAATDDENVTPSALTEGTPRAERPRHAGRRVQTSISLPPETWDALDELGQEAGVSAGELLTSILTVGIPDTPQAALSVLEQLLVSVAPDEGPQEERNYRLPLELRAKLDELAGALGARPRLPRSLLIRAILAIHSPTNGEHARELITTRRVDAMRAALGTSA